MTSCCHMITIVLSLHHCLPNHHLLTSMPPLLRLVENKGTHGVLWAVFWICNSLLMRVFYVWQLQYVSGPEVSFCNCFYIPQGYDLAESFIVTQDPMENTIADFWRMVFDQEVTTIVMLSEVRKVESFACLLLSPIILSVFFLYTYIFYYYYFVYKVMHWWQLSNVVYFDFVTLPLSIPVPV